MPKQPLFAGLVIDETGQVTDTRVLKGQPHFTEAALEAVVKWRFKPGTLNGKPVPQDCAVHFAVPAAHWWDDIVYT